MRKSVHIAAAPSSVWPFVADPALQQLWNPKVVSVHRVRSGPVLWRERFQMVHAMSGQQRQSFVEVLACDPPHRVVFEHRVGWKGQERIARESYVISESRGGAAVTQTIDFTAPRLPWLLLALIWFISSFGRSVEKPYLERLKHAVERKNEPV